MAKKIILSFFFLLLFFPIRAYAQENSFITIVNPQRISVYTKDYLLSFQEELNQVKKRGLPATWPVTYDVLLKDDFVNALKNMDKNQEIGIFLEVTPQFAKDSDVSYNQTNSWHRANSIFTSGYSQKERKKLIDTAFSKFKDTFGYFPKSVGSWYIDAYSLAYMKEAYDITASINMSDQYDLDGYQLWGTPWSTPYYPSSINTAIPGNLDVLMLRWAARDPLSGYKNTKDIEPSLFSLQDYSFIGLPLTYFENLLKTYAIKKPYNQYGHATIGLEGDVSTETYKTLYAQQMDIAKELQQKKSVQILTMRDFASWYKKNVSENVHIIEASDLTGDTKKHAYWMQSKTYRIGIVFDPKTNRSEVVDFRIYPQNLEEPFFKDENSQFTLSMNLPYVIDTVIEAKSAWDLDLGKVKNTEKNTLIFEKGKITFSKNEIAFPQNISFPSVISSSDQITITKNVLTISSSFHIPPSGITFLDFSIHLPFTIKRRLPSFISELIPKLYTPIPQFYTISQTEADALSVLKRLPGGTVLVYDRDCLDCVFTTPFKPAAMAGKKGYVAKYSNKKTVEDISFSTAKSSKIAREELAKKGVRYVYLSKYGSYIEPLPYIPDDLALKRVFTNANTEIWELK